MFRMIALRCAAAVPLLFVISVLAFSLGSLAPVDPARMALSSGSTGVQLDPQEVEAKRVELGLDKPILERYVDWLTAMLSGDFGESFATGEPVGRIIADSLPASMLLAGAAIVVAVAAGIPMGMGSGLRPGGWLDRVSQLMAAACLAMPGFWIALLLMWLFAAKLQWVPALGNLSPTGVILPILVLSLRPLGRLIRLMKTTTMDTLQQDYVQVSRGKGMTDSWTTRRHVLPNALLPIIAVIGLDLSALVANSAVIEWVFAYPGFGRHGVAAARNGDLPVLSAFVVVLGAIVIFVNLTVDVVNGLMNPRLLRDSESANR